ncbi:MAG: hypothetical protein R3A10_07030 [Caldilineaceae bacterium]
MHPPHVLQPAPLLLHWSTKLFPANSVMAWPSNMTVTDSLSGCR